MNKMRKSSKCPTCCPNVPVTFVREATVESGEVVWVWKCPNCGHRKPVGKKRAPRRTARMNAVVERLTANGWTVERTELIGGRLWISATHAARAFMNGQRLYGTIGARGAMRLTLCRPLGDYVVTRPWQFTTYLDERRKPA